MKTASCKAKGRRAQDEVVRSLKDAIYLPAGCQEDDVKPAIMGTSGRDILLSPAARNVLDIVNETKNVECLNVTTTFLKHHKKYASEPGLKILTHRRNHTPMLVTMMWDDLLKILEGK